MDTDLSQRSAQDILAERRANVNEARRERDPIAKATLLAHVAILDAELDQRRKR
jgi:hypothetical protein